MRRLLLMLLPLILMCADGASTAANLSSQPGSQPASQPASQRPCEAYPDSLEQAGGGALREAKDVKVREIVLPRQLGLHACASNRSACERATHLVGA